MTVIIIIIIENKSNETDTLIASLYNFFYVKLPNFSRTAVVLIQDSKSDC